MTVEVLLPGGSSMTVSVSSFVVDPYSRRGAVRVPRASETDWLLIPVEAWRVLP